MRKEDAGTDIALIVAMMAGYELEPVPDTKGAGYRCQFCGIVHQKKEHPVGSPDCPVIRARQVILAARQKKKAQ